MLKIFKRKKPITMKQITKLLTLLAIMSLTIVASCSKEDENPVIGKATIDGVEYPLVYSTLLIGRPSFLDDLGQQVYKNKIVLGDNKEVGFSLWMTIISDADEMVAGTYTYTERDDNVYVLGDFSQSDVTVENSVYKNLTSGTIDVTQSGSGWTIDVNAVLDGHVISAHVVGPVEFRD